MSGEKRQKAIEKNVDAPRFRSIVLDVDSTLAAIEGIDWLARLRDATVAAGIAALTDRAMEGELRLDDVYGERLTLIQPTRAEVDALGAAYVAAVLPDARETLATLRAAGVRVVLVSGGLREAILPLAAHLGVDEREVNAVGIRFDAAGAYAGYDTMSPLTTQSGKARIVEALALPRPILAVGDGATDAAMRDVVDTFAAFTGVVRRDAVVAAARMELTSLAQLLEIVLR